VHCYLVRVRASWGDFVRQTAGLSSYFLPFIINERRSGIIIGKGQNKPIFGDVFGYDPALTKQ
jgi:hypothetical protein